MNFEARREITKLGCLAGREYGSIRMSTRGYTIGPYYDSMIEAIFIVDARSPSVLQRALCRKFVGPKAFKRRFPCCAEISTTRRFSKASRYDLYRAHLCHRPPDF